MISRGLGSPWPFLRLLTPTGFPGTGNAGDRLPRIAHAGSPVAPCLLDSWVDTGTFCFLGRVLLVGEIEAANSVLNMAHLGRKEPVVQPAIPREKRGCLQGVPLRRILLVWSVAAVTATVRLTVVAPAFANKEESAFYECTRQETELEHAFSKKEAKDHERVGYDYVRVTLVEPIQGQVQRDGLTKIRLINTRAVLRCIQDARNLRNSPRAAHT